MTSSVSRVTMFGVDRTTGRKLTAAANDLHLEAQFGTTNVPSYPNVAKTTRRSTTSAVNSSRRDANANWTCKRHVELLHQRHSIKCGVKHHCAQCYNVPPLEEGSSRFYLVDKKLVMNQIDILEDSSVTNIIILQSAFDSIKSRNIHLYLRLKTCLANSSKFFTKFQNIFKIGLYQPQKIGDDSLIYDAKTTYESFKFLSSHLGNVNLITDDPEIYKTICGQSPSDVGIISLSNYIQSQPLLSHLHDKIKYTVGDCRMISDHGQMGEDNNSHFYEHHLDSFQLQCKLRDKSIHKGVFLVTNDVKEKQAIVQLSNEDSIEIVGSDRIFICSDKHRNRAINSESVAVELLPRNEWIKLDKNQLLMNTNDEDPIISLNQSKLNLKRDLDKVSDRQDVLVPCGRIVGILQRKNLKYIGYIDNHSVDPSDCEKNPLLVNDILPNYIFRPSNKKIPNILIRSQQIEKICNSRIMATIDSWPYNSQYPLGHFVKSLGKTTDINSERESIDMEFEIPNTEFSQEVMNCLPSPNYEIPQYEIERREDFRELCIVSVDPPDCKDIDDALHCNVLENKNYEVGVHIADVSHFVLPNSALDKEAADRCTSVYLVDRRIDMIPTRLSTDICSLHQNRERLTFSAIFEIDPKSFKVVKSRFCKSLIRSRAALSYKKAQEMIDDVVNHTCEISEGLRRLNHIAKEMRKIRKSKGLIHLGNYSELKFNLQADKSLNCLADPHVSEYYDTKPMIEEFMLLANIRVAHFLRDNLPETAILRRHEEPNLDALKIVQNNLKSIKIDLNVDSNKSVADSLDYIQSHYSNDVLVLSQSHITRAMMQAKYFCASYFPRSKHMHYGLNSDCYTHFTSPIRRYADLLVHRMLYAVISNDGKNNPILTNRRALNDVCRQINYRTRMAREASRASTRAYMKTYLVGKTLKEDAYVYKLDETGASFYIPKYLVEVNVSFEQIRNDLNEIDLSFDAKNICYTNLKTSKTILKYFDRLLVSLTSKYLQNGELDLKCEILKRVCIGGIVKYYS